MTMLAHHIFAGDHTQALQTELKRWTKGFALKFGEENIETREVNPQTRPAEILSWIQARPMFAEKSLLILEGVWTKLPPESQEIILEAWPHFPEDKVLLFVERTKLDKRLSITKKVMKTTMVKEFLAPEKEAGLQALVERAHQIGLALPYPLAQNLWARCQENLSKAWNELEKLKLLCGNQPVNLSHLEAISIHDEKDSIFELTDAIHAKNFALSLKLLQRLQAQNQEAMYIFTMIYKAVENVWLVQHQKTAGLHPFVVKKLQSPARRFKAEAVEKALLSLAALDQAMKTGKIPYKTQEEDPYFFKIERILYALMQD